MATVHTRVLTLPGIPTTLFQPRLSVGTISPLDELMGSSIQQHIRLVSRSVEKVGTEIHRIRIDGHVSKLVVISKMVHCCVQINSCLTRPSMPSNTYGENDRVGA